MVDINNLKNGRKPVKLQRKVQQDAPGKVNRVKEIRRRGKDGLIVLVLGRFSPTNGVKRK